MTATAPTMLDAVALVAASMARLGRAAEDARRAIDAMRRQAREVAAQVRQAAAETAALIDGEAAELERQFAPPAAQADAAPERGRAIVAATIDDGPDDMAGFLDPRREGHTESSYEAAVRDAIARREREGTAAQVEGSPPPQEPDGGHDDDEDEADEEGDACSPAGEQVLAHANGPDETARRRKGRAKARKIRKR